MVQCDVFQGSLKTAQNGVEVLEVIRDSGDVQGRILHRSALVLQIV